MSTATTAVASCPANCGQSAVQSMWRSRPERMQPSFDNPAVEAFTRSLDKPLPIAVTPGCVDEVAAILRLANRHGFSVFPAGSAGGRCRSVEMWCCTPPV